MKKGNELFKQKLAVVNIGLPSFAESIEDQGGEVVHVDWRPPAGGDPEIIDLLEKLEKFSDRIDSANDAAVRRMTGAQPVLVDVRRAKDVIPGMGERMILHAGSPVDWDSMSGPVKGAVIGALLYEGWAEDREGAERLAASGEITYSPCHHHSAVGPMAGVVSPSMYVFVVENRVGENRAYCTINEGLGKVLRFGAFSDDVIERLKWMEKVLAPALAVAIRISGGIDIRDLTARALMMGDECHNRNVAATSLFIRTIIPCLLETKLDKGVVADVIGFISGNDHFFLNLSMAACKASTDTIAGMENCSIVSVMARNGTDIGIRLAGTGDRWYTAPAGMPKGLYFPGYSEADANPDLGDSTVSEIAGIGAMAMAAAPAIVKFTGGTPGDAVKNTLEMYEICHGEHSHYQIPVLDFRGTPVGVDVRKIVEQGIAPFINTGIAHKDPGIGQVGAGILHAPMEIFVEALKTFAETLE